MGSVIHEEEEEASTEAAASQTKLPSSRAISWVGLKRKGIVGFVVVYRIVSLCMVLLRKR